MRLKEYKEGGGPADKRGYAYNYLLKKGVPSIQAAGIIGNLAVESNFSTTVEGDKGMADGSSYGIAQWRGERLAGLKRFAGSNWTNLDKQLDFVLHELNTSEKEAGQKVYSAKTVEQATEAFTRHYERPNMAMAHLDRRVSNALSVSGMKADPNFKVQGYDQDTQGGQGYGEYSQQEGPYQLGNMYGDEFYNTDRSQNISSLDNSQESSKLAQEKQDRAAEIKARLDQKAAEKTFMAEMIQKSQVAYVNPEDYQTQPASVNYQAPQQFQRGGNIPVSSQGMYEFPNQEVLVPTDGNITMKDITHDILGISKETGEQILMKPEQEYFFPNTKTVLEIPQTKKKTKTNRFSR